MKRLFAYVMIVGCLTLLQTACAHRNRDAWQKPSEVVRALNIAPGSQVADLGAGDGYFTFRLADAAGKSGAVYAVDVDDEALNELRAAAAARGYSQIRTIRAAEANPNLPDGGVDLLFVCNTYHHLSDRTEYFRRIRSALRPNGRVAIIELANVPWYYPLWGHETPAATIRDEMTKAGYLLEQEHAMLDYQNFQVFSTRP
jgi:arsenite methyltransferase